MQQVKIRVAAIINKKNKFLFVKLKKEGREFWIPPGGGLEYQETLSECVIREVKEETFLDIQPEKIVYMRDLIGDNKHELEIFFYATLVGGKLTKGVDPEIRENHSLEEVKWMTLEELNKVKFFPEEIIPLLEKISESGKIPDFYYAGKHEY